jgi:ATP-dependent Clp protease protease subunit
MPKREIIKLGLNTRPQNYRPEPPQSAVEKWNPGVHAAETDDTNINIYDVIGENPWDGSGVTVKLVSSILRRNKGKAITVNINSPGGDFFEGIAIYNALAGHDGEVNVRVIGLAASAASIIAMAGDNVAIGESAFLMIHNAWTIALGDKNDMADVSEMLSKFDESMVSLYCKHCGKDEDEVRAMMNRETWLVGKDAVEEGFADNYLDSDELGVEEDPKNSYSASIKKVDLALARQGMPRTERRKLLKDISGTPSAADDTTPGAGKKEEEPIASALLEVLTGYGKETDHAKIK